MAERRKKNYRKAEDNAFRRNGFGPDAAEPKVQEWRSLSELLEVRQGEKCLELVFEMEAEPILLKVTAPGFGGIRIASENPGYFVPEELLELTRSQKGEEDVWELPDGGRLVVRQGRDWRMELYDAKEICQRRFGEESFAFGYEEGELVSIRLAWPVTPDELLFGLGERFSGLNQNGNRHMFWNMDCAYHGDSEGLELWRSYKNIPLVHSDRGYTMFFSSYYPAVSDLGYTDETRAVWEFWGPVFDLFLWTGDLKDRIGAYTELTGKPFLPPRWAFRYMSGGGNGFWYGADWGNGNIPEKYLEVLKDTLEGYERLGTPYVAALYGEGWISDNPKAYEMLEAYGIRMLRWNPPDFSLEEMRKFLPGVPDEKLPRISSTTGCLEDVGHGNYIDFFAPNACELIRNRFGENFNLGMSGGMLDFAEMVPEQALYCNGVTGRQMHNWNPYWYTKIYGEAASEALGNDYLYFCRGGCAGSQRWAATFSGDQPAAMHGLRQQLSAALTIGLCGFSAWGGDLAGYEGIPDPETFIRGLQFAAFQPLMRAHGTRTRCPWDFGPDAELVYQRYYWLRENLVELLYSSAIRAQVTGLPMMKPMVLAFPQEREFADNDTQYFFCDHFLVAPVLYEGVREIEVCFPGGSWYELWSGRREAGPRRKQVPVTLEDIPVYLQAGSVFPVTVGTDLKLAQHMELAENTKALVIVPPDDSHRNVCYKAANRKTVFAAVRNQEGSFTVTASKPMGLCHFIVYGPVESVWVDGKPVPFTVIEESAEGRITRLELAVSSWMMLTFYGM